MEDNIGNSPDYIPKDNYDTILKDISQKLYNQTEISNKLEFNWRESLDKLKYETALIIKKYKVIGKELPIDCQNEIIIETKKLRDYAIKIEKDYRKELNEKKRLETQFYSVKELSFRQIAKLKGSL